MWFFVVTVVFFLFGVIVTLFLQWYFLYYKYFSDEYVKSRLVPDISRKTVELPQELHKLLENMDYKKKESCLVFNLICQFLFKELNHTTKVRRWFMKKLSVEFEELLQKTAAGKLLEQVTVRDLYLGSQFPLIRSVSVQNVQLSERKDCIEELDIAVDLEYSGGFQLSVDADMVLGRSAFLSVKVASIKGQVRLQFTRLPFSHWSFAFCDEPLMEFKVESHFQGRPLPQVTSLIVNQIRRSVRKRHTLPNYKIRFKPFFIKPEPPIGGDEVYLFGNKITEGVMDVTVLECSRLFRGQSSAESLIYCTLAVDLTAWVEMVFCRNASYAIRDLDISRLPGQYVGVTFKQEFILEKYEQCVVVETVAVSSPACCAGVNPGDILVAINGIKVTSMTHATKLFKQATDKLTIRIERRAVIKYSPSQECLFRDEDSSFPNPSVTNDEMEESSKESRTSSARSSPASSSPARKSSLPKKGGQNVGVFQKNKGSGEVAGNTSRDSSENKHATADFPLVDVDCPLSLSLKRTSAIKFTQDLLWKETFTFEVEEQHRYLNVCVWCKNPERSEKQDRTPKSEKDVLLGHVSILLLDIAMECASNSQGHHQRTFNLLPPEPKATASRTYKLATHPGFDESLCYGDVTLGFVYTPQRLPERAKNLSDVSTNEIGQDSEDESFSVMDDNEQIDLQHDFIITQFTSTIPCHFCGKKIWLKMAFQCKTCALICHKKCAEKCQATTKCNQNSSTVHASSPTLLTDPQGPYKGPEIITTDTGQADSDMKIDEIESEVPCVQDESDAIPIGRSSVFDSPGSKRRLQSLLSNLTSSVAQNRSSLPRVGSAHNLAPPAHQTFPTHSKSLPPSPQTSPAPSRKASLQGNIFALDCGSETEEDMETTVQRLLQYASDEAIVSAAKEKGRELYITYSLRERKEKLNSMVTKLQSEIDMETANRNQLARIERTTDPIQKTRVALLLAKSDEKIQALAILMLYYCSGLQHCQEQEVKKEINTYNEGANSGVSPTNDQCL